MCTVQVSYCAPPPQESALTEMRCGAVRMVSQFNKQLAQQRAALIRGHINPHTKVGPIFINTHFSYVPVFTLPDVKVFEVIGLPHSTNINVHVHSLVDCQLDCFINDHLVDCQLDCFINEHLLDLVDCQLYQCYCVVFPDTS